MSLLLDARRKIELALEQTGSHKKDESRELKPREMQLSDDALISGARSDLGAAPARSTPEAGNLLPAKAGAELTPPVGTPLLRSDPTAAPARSTPVGTPLLRSDPTAAGKNLFAAKPALVQGSLRLGIIPIALISGAAIAAGWGFYVWHEINPPAQVLYQPSKQPPAAPIVSMAPPVQPVSGAAAQENITAAKAPASFPAPIPLATSMQAASTKKTAKAATKQPSILPKQKPRPSPDAGTKESKAPPADAVQAMSIERGQRQNGINPTLLAAWQAYRRGDFDLARQHYSNILKQDMKSRDALLGMAAIAQQQGQDDDAVHYYRQVLTLDPRDPVAHAGLLPLLGPGYEADMESRLKLLLVQQPQSPALHFAMGNMYAEQSRWSDAQQYYSSASNLDPGNALYAFNLAVSQDHMGKWPFAAQHYQRALQLDNDTPSGIDRKQIQKRLDELMAAHQGALQ